jgi:hypothetical protein
MDKEKAPASLGRDWLPRPASLREALRADERPGFAGALHWLSFTW